MEVSVDRVNTIRAIVWHKEYNLDKKDSLDELPEDEAVFGVFAIINEEPINCRYVGVTRNLRQTIKELFEKPPGDGLKKFMQGPWIKMVQYYPVRGTLLELGELEEQWVQKCNPGIDEEGEYPGYYD